MNGRVYYTLVENVCINIHIRLHSFAHHHDWGDFNNKPTPGEWLFFLGSTSRRKWCTACTYWMVGWVVCLLVDYMGKWSRRVSPIDDVCLASAWVRKTTVGFTSIHLEIVIRLRRIVWGASGVTCGFPAPCQGCERMDGTSWVAKVFKETIN